MEGKFSWKLLDDGSVLKILDKSSFVQNETAIDKDFGHFFNFDDSTKSSNIIISYQSKKYGVALKRRSKGGTSMRMIWGGDFGAILKEFFHGWETREAYDGIDGMKLQFNLLKEKNSFKVDLIKQGSYADELIKFNQSVDDLFGKLKEPPKGRKTPESYERTIKEFNRDPAVKAWVLQESNGFCELCNDKAFLKSNNDPYLEVHHLRKLSDNGSDTISNSVAICANCHRKLHYAHNKDELLNNFYSRIQRLKKE